MYSLFIDTHSQVITVAFINDEKTIKSERESINSHSIYLLPMIKELMASNNIKMGDLKEIIVINGPGSFTGIRIGLSVAKTLAYALNIPIKTISSLTAYLVSSEQDNKLAIIEDNKGYFISAFDKENHELRPEIYVTELTDMKKTYNIVPNELDIEKIYDYVKNIKEINVHLVKANYIKQIEALK